MQLDGMSPDQYRAWQRGYEDLKKRVVTLELELQVWQGREASSKSE
jgi:hypothetical protein